MIVDVKKINLFILKEQKEDLLKLLQIHELLMPLDNKEALKADVSDLDELLVRVNRTIKYLESIRLKRTFFAYKEATYEEFDDRSDKYLRFLKEVESDEKRASDTTAEINKLDEEISLYLPFLTNELNLEDMAQTEYFNFYHGFVEEKMNLELKAFFTEHKLAHSFFDTDKRGTAVTFAAVKEDEVYLQEVRRLDFKEIKLPIYDGDINEYIENLQIEKTNKELFLKETLDKLNTHVENLDYLYTYADQIASDKLRILTTYEVHNEELDIIKFTGWIKVKEEDALKDVLTDAKFDYEIEEVPLEEDETPPTALENNKFVEPFETISSQYSDPLHNELDPNPAMSFWYWIIFGIMMGDVGYGLILVIGLGLFLKYLKPKGGMKKLITVLYYSGYTTILFGILHGSLFGVNFDLGKLIGSIFNQNWTTVLLNPMENALEMLIYSLVIGFIQINHGFLLKAKLQFKLKDPKGAFGEGISYMLILTGIGLIVLSLVLNISIWIGISVIIAGSILIILFMGHNNKGVFSKISSKLGGFYRLINVLSDILSYSRILALALSTAVIAFTFNNLAGMMQGSVIGFGISIVVYIIGHVFNLAMGLLSTYIHDSRLQYVEFFGKFFEGGGYLFKPLALELNHLNEINNNKDIGGN